MCTCLEIIEHPPFQFPLADGICVPNTFHLSNSRKTPKTFSIQKKRKILGSFNSSMCSCHWIPKTFFVLRCTPFPTPAFTMIMHCFQIAPCIMQNENFSSSITGLPTFSYTFSSGGCSWSFLHWPFSIVCFLLLPIEFNCPCTLHKAFPILGGRWCLVYNSISYCAHILVHPWPEERMNIFKTILTLMDPPLQTSSHHDSPWGPPIRLCERSGKRQLGCSETVFRDSHIATYQPCQPQRWVTLTFY